MKTLVIVLDVLAGLLLFSTLVCGLWMRSQVELDPSSVGFHATIGIATVVVTALAMILSTISMLRVA